MDGRTGYNNLRRSQYRRNTPRVPCILDVIAPAFVNSSIAVFGSGNVRRWIVTVAGLDIFALHDDERVLRSGLEDGVEPPLLVDG
jgi:hypothetical protein